VGKLLTEADFQKQVIDLAHLLQYRVAHFRPAKTDRGWRTPVSADGAGFPDLVLVGRGRVIFAELKSDKGKLSEDQKAWVNALRSNGAQAYVWRPSDMDEVVATLT